MKSTVGSVPYTNAIPLVAWFEELGRHSPVRVIYDVPSRLPAMLDSGQAEAILVSSVDALLVPGRRMAEGVCIGSHGPVKSVRLFSKIPPSEIRTLAWDSSSMTSNRLAMILLAERFGIQPSTRHMAPNQAEMLAECDACVLIGDIGMRSPSEGLHVLDLGEEWRNLTGKPFVWAAWIGGEGLTEQLAGWLNTAASSFYAGRSLGSGRFGEEVESRRRQLLDLAEPKSGWPRDVLEDYFFQVMVYDMGEASIEGLREFQRLLLKHGFDDCRHFPEIVRANLEG